MVGLRLRENFAIGLIQPFKSLTSSTELTAMTSNEGCDFWRWKYTEERFLICYRIK